jgi:hypothetical protein
VVRHHHTDLDSGDVIVQALLMGDSAKAPTSAWSVRRFAAVDMFGASGTLRRRRIILAEFVFGSVGLWVFSIFMLSQGFGLVGIVVAGLALNYSALACYAILLYPSGRLERELTGVNLRSELRRYTSGQLLVLVPGLLFLLAILEVIRRTAHD